MTMKWLIDRRKAIVAVLGAGLTAAAGLGLTGTAQQLITIALALVTAAGVYGVRNGDKPVPKSAAHLATPAARGKPGA